MTKPPERFLLIDTHAAGDLFVGPIDPEIVGHAFRLLLRLSRGHQDDDETMRLACLMSPRLWRKLGPKIKSLVVELTRVSEPRRRFGRAPLSPTQRERIFARDGRVCRYCSATDGPFHIDHIVPVARGGNSRDENLCVACAPCNFAKRAKLVSEWSY